MKKYYIDDINIDKLKNLNQNLTIWSENIILTYEGLIKIVNDSYVKFILEENDPQLIEDFVNNKTLYIDNSYYKKDDIIYQIPYYHKKIKITYKKYIIDKKYKVYFIKEIINNKIVDYYFSTKENIDILQNAIFTFLNELN